MPQKPPPANPPPAPPPRIERSEWITFRVTWWELIALGIGMAIGYSLGVW